LVARLFFEQVEVEQVNADGCGSFGTTLSNDKTIA